MSPMLPQQTGELFHRVDDKVAKIRSKARGTSIRGGGGEGRGANSHSMVKVDLLNRASEEIHHHC